MKYYSSILALALGTVAFQAQAQDAAAPPPDQDASAPATPQGPLPPASPSSALPAPDAAAPAPDTDTDAATPSQPDSSVAAASTQVTDQEIDSFAQATVKVQKISTDATLDQTAKQQQMASAVKGAGLDPTRYNQIGQAIASDTALRARVQTAMAKYATPPQG